MAAAENELEEGELTDSDSMREEETKENGAVGKTSDKTPAVKQYSLFDSKPRAAQSFMPISRPPNSDSDSGDTDSSDDDSDSDQWAKKTRFQWQDSSDLNQPQFVNPNFVKNGGVMPPLPKPTNRNVWGSVLQEQILTAEVGGFTMERKVQSDRDVESYDYTRAAEDDRPDPDEVDIIAKEDELFGEVIDLDRAAALQHRDHNRKRVRERIGDRRHMKDKPHGRHHITAESPVEEVVYSISSTLHESKVHLIRRVVQEVGRAKALDLLRKTEEIEAAGGMMTMNGSRRRTPGGVFLQLLKTDPDVTKQQHDKIFEEENRWFQEQKKKKRAKARQRKRQQQAVTASKISDKGDDAEQDKQHQSGTMETEDSASLAAGTSPDAAAGNVASDENDGLDSDGAVSDEEEEGEDTSDSNSRGSFSEELQQELRRQAKERERRTDGVGKCEVDVLEIEAEDDILD